MLASLGLAALLLLGMSSATFARGHSSRSTGSSSTRSRGVDHSDPANGWGTFKCKSQACLGKHPDGSWDHPLTAKKEGKTR